MKPIFLTRKLPAHCDHAIVPHRFGFGFEEFKPRDGLDAAQA